MERPRPRAAIFIDSRGRHLKQALDSANDPGTEIDVHFYPGTDFVKVCQHADKYIRARPQDVLYVSAGINNITYKDRETRAVSFNWNSGRELLDGITSMIANEIIPLRQAHVGTTIHVCAIPAMELARACDHYRDGDQAMLDAVIWDINQEIDKLNRDYGTTTPWLSRSVHASHRRRNVIIKKTNYDLLTDGLHPSTKLLEKWASILVNHIRTQIV